MMVHVTDRLITSAEASRILGRSLRTVHRLAESGALTPAQKLPGPNGAYLFRRRDVERFAVKVAS